MPMLTTFSDRELLSEVTGLTPCTGKGGALEDEMSYGFSIIQVISTFSVEVINALFEQLPLLIHQNNISSYVSARADLTAFC